MTPDTTPDTGEPTIETTTARHVVGTAADYTIATRHGIPGQWQAFFDAGLTIAGTVPGAMYGVSLTGDAEDEFRYVVGVEVDPVPDTPPAGCTAVRLSGGTYAVLRRFGPMTELPARLDWMVCDWLPNSAYRGRAGAMFERYPDDARNGPLLRAYELWLPVARRPRRKKG